MARDSRRDAEPQSDARPPGSFISFLTGLMAGLTVAAVVYFTMSAQVPQQAPGGKPRLPGDPGGVPTDTASTPKPTFDFYKILPESESKVPDTELTAEPPKPSVVVPAPADSAYLLQVGSYQKFEEADQAKAQLALQGITSTIQQVVNKGHEVWYRVHVGPIKTMDEVQTMRARLVEGGATVVVLKVGASP